MMGTTDSPIWIHYPIGLLLAGATSRVWVGVDLAGLSLQDRLTERGPILRARWFSQGVATGLTATEQLRSLPGTRLQAEGELVLEAPRESGEYTIELDVTDERAETVCERPLQLEVSVSSESKARAALMSDVRPLSYAWGTDRGLPAHRYYLETFLGANSQHVRGRCLEFQNPAYAHRFGSGRMASLDILHIDDSSPHATLVADLTKPNAIPSDSFDCIICTHVLHLIFDLELAVRELHRILKPGGVLLVGVPHVSMYDPEIGELWRFTEQGLRMVLERGFPGGSVEVQGFGNSLVAAGDLRGMTVDEFSTYELDAYDPWCPAEVCGRAVKRGAL